MDPYSGQRGFSLLELLVALTIFSLISTAGYSGLNSLSKAMQLQRAQSEQLADIQLGLARLERDIYTAITRSQRTENLNLPAFSGDNRQLNLVTLSGDQTLPQSLSDERPIQWQWQQPVLHRQLWQLPDRLSSNPPLTRIDILENLDQFGFRYLDSNGNWQGQWNSDAQGGFLPLAIMVTARVESFGNIRRVLELPGRRR